jgi:hypothetical protein
MEITRKMPGLLLSAIVGMGCGKDDAPPKQIQQVELPKPVEQEKQNLVAEKVEKRTEKEKPRKGEQDDLTPMLKRLEDALGDQIASLGKEGWVRRSFTVGPKYVSWRPSGFEVSYFAKKGSTEVFQSVICKTEAEARKAPLSTLPVEYMSFRFLLTSKDGRYVATGLKKVHSISCETVDHRDLSPLDPIHSIWAALQKVSGE